MFRPARMAWVDVLADPDGAGGLLERLGSAGIIELRPQAGAPAFVTAGESIRDRLEGLARHIQPFQSWLPPPEPDFSTVEHSGVDGVVAGIEAAVQDWLAASGPAIAEAQAARSGVAELHLLDGVLAALPAAAIDFADWPHPGEESRVYAPFLAIGPEDAIRGVADAGVEAARRYSLPGNGGAAVLLGLAARPQLPALERQWHARGMRFVNVPAGLHGPPAEARLQVRARLARAENRLGRALAWIGRANREFRIGGALWLLRRCLWAQRVLGEDAARGRHFVWLGGWTPRRRLRELQALLDATGVAYLLNVDHAVRARAELPPVELFNPPFARGFEVFVRAFGVPAVDEVDPSTVLSVLMPLLFGYMFGDVGHGIVLALFGRYAGRRLPLVRLLVPAGLSSAAFGFLYGEIFGFEHLLPALGWRPLDEPMLTLLLPLAIGALMLLVGFAFEAQQSYVAGAMRHWWQSEFPLVVLYLGALAAPFAPWWLGLCAAAALAAMIGGARRPAALAAELAEILHALLQLAVNTVSFMRVGAFSLAHAGLSAAVSMLAQIPETGFGQGLVWVAGNVLVIGLEGLVVSVQTTRLILFEFFRRFLHGGGRPFRPLTLPPELALHSNLASFQTPKGVSA